MAHALMAAPIACTNALGAVTASPTLPGSSLLMNIISGVLYVAIGVCVIGLIVAGMMMAIGHYSGNGNLNARGRSALPAAFIGCLVCGGAIALVNFAFSAGQSIHC